jgi:glycosyltransferase involved in cell wall biosynthesis
MKKTILINSFACSPHWGSEIGMGYNWIKLLSQNYNLHVMTEESWKKYHNDDKNVTFHYIKMSSRGLKKFWKGNSLEFYFHYNIWQRKALVKAQEIINTNKIDAIHQLNMIGFRELGYLWKIKNLPYIVGPIGGIDNFPKNYNNIFLKNFKYRFKTFLKNKINNLQFNYNTRLVNIGKRSSSIIAVTKYGQNLLEKKLKRKILHLPETGVHYNNEYSINESSRDIDVIWVGRMEDRKALPILSEALRNFKKSLKVVVIGDGDMSDVWLNDLFRNNEKHEIIFHKLLKNDKVQHLMSRSKILAFTSLREGTPHVISEGFANGCQIISHKISGIPNLCNNQNSFLVEPLGFNHSVDSFVKNIDEILSNNKSKPKSFLTWDNLRDRMFEIYRYNGI